MDGEQQQVDVKLFAQADGELVQVDVGLLKGAGEPEGADPVAIEPVPADENVAGPEEATGGVVASDVERVEVEDATKVVVDASPARKIQVGAIPVWGYGVGWVVTIVLVAQATKALMKALGARERLGRKKWRQWMYVVPVIWGVILSGLFGPQVGELFGLRFGMVTSMLFLGPGSGAAAAFAYDVFRGVVLPVLPETLTQIIEKLTGVKIKDETVDAIRLLEESDAIEDTGR